MARPSTARKPPTPKTPMKMTRFGSTGNNVLISRRKSNLYRANGERVWEDMASPIRTSRRRKGT